MLSFAKAKGLWDARPYQDYSYEIRTFCFCPPEMTQWTTVVVENGVVIDAFPSEENPTYPLNTTLLFQPIDSVFSQLRRAMRERGFNSTYADIEAEYHDTLGYPERIVYQAAPFVADAGATIEIRHVQPLFVPAQSLRQRH